MSPAQQSIVNLVEILNKIKGVSKVNITLSELEKNVEDIKITLDGDDLSYEDINNDLKDFGAVIRNVDGITSEEEDIQHQENDKLSASMLVLARHIDSKIGKIDQIYDEFDGALKHIQSKKV